MAQRMINSSMYRGQRSATPFGSYQEGQKHGSNMQALADQRAQQEATKQAFAKATKQNPDGTTSIDYGLAMKDLAGVNPEMAVKLDQHMTAQKAAQEKLAQEKKAQEVDEMARHLEGVKDPVSYEKAKTIWEAKGKKWPQFLGSTFDPYKIETARKSAIPYQQLLSNKLKREELDVKRKALRAKKSGSGLPKPPSGYMWNPAGTEVVPIPGGPAAGKKEDAKKMKAEQAGVVVQDIGRSLNLIKDYPSASGSIMGQTSFIPGTPADRLEKMLETVKANIGFDKLQAMRDASPTGGALGQVSENENRLLQATAGKLDTSLPTPMLEDNLKRLYNKYLDIVHGEGNGPERKELSFDEDGNPIVPNKKPGPIHLLDKNADEMSDDELDMILGI